MIAGVPSSVLPDEAARGRLVRFGARFPGRAPVMLVGPGAVIEGPHAFRLEAAMLEAGAVEAGPGLPTWSGPALMVVGRGRARLRHGQEPALQLGAGDVAYAPPGWEAGLAGADGALSFAIGAGLGGEGSGGPDVLRANQRSFGPAPYGGGALAAVAGTGLGGKPGPLEGPAGVAVEWLRLEPGRSAGPFVLGSAMVLMVQQGGALLRLNGGAQEVRVPLGPWDLFSVPAEIAWRASCAGDQALVALLVSGRP